MILFAYDGEIAREELLSAIDEKLKERGEKPIGTIRYDERGAPVCKGYFVSITHTGAKIVIAVSATPVGIDLEKSDRASRVSDIQSWTAYEARRKLTGEGIRLSDVREGLPREEARYFDIFPGYTLAVAGGERDCETVLLPKR